MQLVLTLVIGCVAVGVLFHSARMLLHPEAVGRDLFFMERGFFWVRIFGVVGLALGLLFAAGVVHALFAAF